MDNPKQVTKIPATQRDPSLLKVAIYARISTARAEQFRRLSAQVSVLTKYVSETYNWILKDVYMDIGSRTTGSLRQEYSRLLEDCKSGKIKYVITKEMSVFGDSAEVLAAVRDFTGAGAKVFFLEEKIELDHYYAVTELFLKDAFYQSDHRYRSESIKRGLKVRAENGSSRLYRRPCYGYKKNEKGELICEDYQSAVVSRIFDLYLEGKSLSNIINILAEDGILSPRGSERWSKRAVETILTNLKYTGNVETMKTDPTGGSYVIQDSHMAIVSMEKFTKVQKEIINRAKRKRQIENLTYLFLEEND